MRKLQIDQKVFAAALLGGAALWALDAFVDAYVFQECTFLDSLLGHVTLHELYFRSLFVASFLVLGFVSSRLLKKRRETEVSLREAIDAYEDERTRSASVLQAIADGISIQSRDYRVLYQNDVHKKLVGDHQGEYCFEAYAKRESICDGCPVAEAFQDGATHVLEKNVPGEGGNRHIEIYASPLRNSKGEIIAGIEAVRDITERKRLEAALQDQKRFAEGVIENSAVATFVVSPAHTVLLWNKACEELTGVPASSMIGTDGHWKPFYPGKRPTLADVVIDGSVEALPSLYSVFSCSTFVKGGLQAEGWYRNMNGRDRYIVFNAVPIHSGTGELAVVIETLHDITGRRKAEEALKKMNAQLQTLIHAIPDMVMFKDAEGRHLIVNKAVEDLTGHPASEIVGRTADELLPPASARACKQSDEEALARRSAVQVEERVTDKDGNERYIDFVKAPIVDDAQKPVGLVSIGRDITERKRIELELQAHREHLGELVRERTRELLVANERLEQEIAERQRMEDELIRVQKLESLSLLAGGIAHDFNNLLASIMGTVSLAMLDLPPDSPVTQQLAGAERASLRARELTQQLLTFSKGGAPVKTYGSLEEVVRDTAAFSLRGSKTGLEFSFPGDFRPVEADLGQLSQVFNNLIINADQAMPNGGTITITGENVLLGAADLPPLPEGKYVRITVRDQGIGIPKEYLSKVFDPYFTTKQKGSGLGLAITYSIIRKHGGFITVESAPGAGAEFRIYLPAAEERRVAPRPRNAAPLTGTGRILVMDDEADVRKTTGDILTRLGYTVAFAEEGGAAVELYRQAKDAGSPFAVTIMDLTVPGGMGGKDAVRKLLEIDPGAKVIVSSGYSQDPVMAEFASYGFTDVVMKPFRVKELGEAVQRVLRGETT